MQKEKNERKRNKWKGGHEQLQTALTGHECLFNGLESYSMSLKGTLCIVFRINSKKKNNLENYALSSVVNQL